MSKTLFWYILRDLVKIFLMASGVLAAIMAFGGLLKPLTEYGLDATQAAKMLACFMPATQTYSLPIAALFATTMVYGRLASDNELTACRASGISNMSLTLPAVVMGLTLAIVSLLCLCFVAPHFLLKAERVVFNNIAEVVKRKIDRAHQIQIGNYTIFANSAQVEPSPPGDPNTQIVTLYGVVFAKYGGDANSSDPPKEIWTASRADAYIRRGSDEEVHFEANLTDGMHLDYNGVKEVVKSGFFGPIEVPSPIREKTQFMDVRTLQALYADPSRSRKVREQLDHLLQTETAADFLKRVAQELNQNGKYEFPSEDGVVTLTRGTPKAAYKQNFVELTSDPDPLGGAAKPETRLSWQKGTDSWTDDALTAHVTAEVTTHVDSQESDDRIYIEVNLIGESHQMPGGPPSMHKELRHTFSIPLPPQIKKEQQAKIDTILRNAGTRRQAPIDRSSLPEAIRSTAKMRGDWSADRDYGVNDVVFLNGAGFYALTPSRGVSPDSDKLKWKALGKVDANKYKELVKVWDDVLCHITTEGHARASFAVSCLILVMVGCALGMLFKSGDFLTAFGISVVPALLTIALVSTGQHLGENGPKSLHAGIMVIWSGNIGVLVLAVVLLLRLQRQ